MENSMKTPIFKILMIAAVLVILAGVMGGLLVKAQGQNVAADETRPGDSQPTPPGNNPLTSETDPVGDDHPGAAPLANQASKPGPDAAAPNDSNSPDVNYKWLTTTGSAFVPSSSTITWGYSGGGCIQPTSAGDWRASLNLTDGDIIKYFYFGYWNYSGSTASNAYLTEYSSTAVATTLASLTSAPGSSGTGARYTYVSLNYTVNNSWDGLNFLWTGSTNQDLCFMQVGYLPHNIFGAALPTLLNQP
jgi:hypothetical protein